MENTAVDRNLLDRLCESVLENRGIHTAEQWDSFCPPNMQDLPDLPDINRMLEELHKIHESHKPIAILSHDDTDGILSAVIAKAGLTELGFDAFISIPDPMNPKHGYGMSREDLDSVVKKGNPCAVLICDLNVTGNDQIDHRYAREKGLDLLVADHHSPEHLDPDSLNDMIYVNPWREDMPVEEQFPEDQRDICGAGIVWMILHAYAEKYDADKLAQTDRLQVFAGIAAIADWVKLSYISRMLVINSIDICRKQVYGCGTCDAVMRIEGTAAYKQAFQGLFYLIRETEDGLLYSDRDINEDFYRKALIPLLNTPHNTGRNLDEDIYSGLFFTDEPPFEKIQKLQEKRREYSDEVDEAMSTLTSYEGSDYIWVYDKSGKANARSLASRKLDETGNPTIVVYSSGKDLGDAVTLTGSLRSPDWIPLKKALSREDADMKDIISCTGHDYAAGVKLISSKDDDIRAGDSQKISKFIDEQIDIYKNNLVEEIPDLSLSICQNENKEYEILCNIADDATHESYPINADTLLSFVEQTNAFSPYGEGFSPLRVELCLRDIKAENISAFGKEEKKHLKIKLFIKQDGPFPLELDILCYNQAEMESKINENTYLILRDGRIDAEKQDPPMLQITGRIQIPS